MILLATTLQRTAQTLCDCVLAYIVSSHSILGNVKSMMQRFKGRVPHAIIYMYCYNLLCLLCDGGGGMLHLVWSTILFLWIASAHQWLRAYEHALYFSGIHPAVIKCFVQPFPYFFVVMRCCSILLKENKFIVILINSLENGHIVSDNN